MVKNNIFYGFVNGQCGLPQPGVFNTYSILNTSILNIGSYLGIPKLHGKLSQPLITLGAKYPITGFTPNWNLTPTNFDNVIFWIQNGIEVISNQTIPLNNTVTIIPFNNPLLPILTFANTNALTFYTSNPVIDPGVTAINYKGISVPVYMINLSLNNNNILTNNILISSNTTVISNDLPVETYTATYVGTDSNNNVGIAYKTINILPIPLPVITLTRGSAVTAYYN